MRKDGLHIWLFEPEIPQNVGTIARLVAADASRLHIIRPTPFSMDDRNLNRAGLDYWPFLDLEFHDRLDDVAKFSGGEFGILTTKVKRTFKDLPPSVCHLLFGKETAGLPPEFMERHRDKHFTIPMVHPGVRSLNLACSVSTVLHFCAR